MSGTLQTTPWNITPYGTPGSFGPPSPAPLQHLLQQLQFVPQQLQNVQYAGYLQQQQLQQVAQVLQIVPHQIQQLLQVVQFLPQQVALLVQQALTQSSIGGAAVPFGGIAAGQPLQSIGFGSSFPSIQPMTSTPFAGGQGYVM
jgi:hypothetical protein